MIWAFSASGTLEFYSRTLVPQLNQGLVLSLEIIVPSAILGLALGILAGAGRATGPVWLRKLLDGYVALFRGTPLVVQLMMWYYGLPNLAAWLRDIGLGPYLGPVGKILTPSAYAASVLAFSACSGAYHSEYIRGALLSIKKGQYLAAEALGFTKGQTFWNVAAPMALRRAVPGCGNEIIYLIKYSSLALIVTVSELTGQAKGVASLSFRHLECYFLVAVYYLGLVTIATWLLGRLEKAVTIPGSAEKGG